MFCQKCKIGNFLSILTFIALAVGCNLPSSSSQTKFSAGHTTAQADAGQVLSAYTSVVSSQQYQDQVTAMKQTPWQNVSLQLAQDTSNDAILIDGYEFDSVQDILPNLDSGFQSVGTSYATLGDYWSEIGVDPTTQVSSEEFLDGLSILNSYRKINFADLQNWVNSNKTLAQQLASKDSHIAVAKVLVVALVGQLSTDNSMSSSGSAQLALTSSSATRLRTSARSEVNNNVYCGGATYCDNGDGYSVNLPSNLRPLINNALAQPAMGDQMVLTDSNNNMVCDMPVCINGGNADRQTIVPDGYQRPSNSNPTWTASSVDPCAGLPANSSCHNNLICGPDTLICNNGNHGSFTYTN